MKEKIAGYVHIGDKNLRKVAFDILEGQVKKDESSVQLGLFDILFCVAPEMQPAFCRYLKLLQTDPIGIMVKDAENDTLTFIDYTRLRYKK